MAQANDRKADRRGTNLGSQVGENIGIVNNNFYAPAERAESPTTPSLNVPFRRDDDFVDRGGLLEQMADMCSRPASRVALVGIGGVGKSQLAIEFCHRLHEISPDTWVFWIYASNISRIEQGFRELAEHARISDRRNLQANIFELVARWLQNEKNGKWLVVLDNLDDESVFSLQHGSIAAEDGTTSPQKRLSTYLPQSAHGTILITSRRRDVAAQLVETRDMLPIEAMSENDAKSLLARKLQAGETAQDIDLHELVTVLECMPLAIVQAAAYIHWRRPRYSVTQYIKDFQQSDRQGSVLLSRNAGHLRRDEEAKNSIITTWQISFDYIRKERPSAADLLALMSFFDRKSIPEYVLRTGKYRNDINDQQGNGRDDESDQGEGDTFEEDLCALRDFSFVTSAVDNATFSMHRLVQLAMRTWLKKHDRIHEYMSLFYRHLRNAFRSTRARDWTRLESLLPHAKAAETQEPQQRSNDQEVEDWASIVKTAIVLMKLRGNLHDSESLALKLMTVMQKVRGCEAELTLRNACDLADLYSQQGRWSEAEELLAQTMNTSMRVFGKEHSCSRKPIKALAVFYYEQQRYKEAEVLQLQIVEFAKKRHGKKHLSTLKEMYRLTLIHQSQGHLVEAEELGIQVMNTSKRVLGGEHPHTLRSVSLLATTYSMQGRPQKAEELYVAAVDIQTKMFGEEDLRTLQSISDLARFYETRDRLDVAEGLAIKVFNIMKKQFGEEDAGTQDIALDLVSLYGRHGQLSEAEELGTHSLNVCKRTFGDAHILTGTAMHRLATIYSWQGRRTRAEELEIERLNMYKRTRGDEHVSTLSVMDELSEVYFRHNRYEKAEELAVQVMTIKRKVLGIEHPETLTSMDILAKIYYEQHHYDKTEELEVQVVSTRRKALGDGHPNTLTSMANLAKTYCEQNSYEKAEELESLVMRTSQNLLGKEHPDTLQAMSDLAFTLDKQDQVEEAIALMVGCAELSVKVLGVDCLRTRLRLSMLSQWTNKRNTGYSQEDRENIPVLEVDLD